jgi:type 1 glutamine amidotransferase
MVRLAMLAVLLVLHVPAHSQDPPGLTEDDVYPVHTVPIPEDIVLEVGGLLVLPDDALLVCTRRGDIWRIDAPLSDAPRFSLWADGLQEPLGLLADGDAVLTVQRGELTRLSDTDGDGRADVYETVNDDWNLSGSYHEYAFGPRRDPAGNLWITLNIPFGPEPFSKVDWRGWALRIPPGGPAQPVAAGLRSPAGVGISPGGDVFYTDNQGEWCGASKLSLLREGSFHGHPMGIDSAHRPESLVEHPGELPNGTLMPTAARRFARFELPAVWFPYDHTGRSPSGMSWDTSDGAFGPYAGQLFVGDQYGANVLRVFLEQVDGRWQGACFRFREGLASGVIRVQHDGADGLWVGMSDRGWKSLGPEQYGLQHVRWNGETPFELLSIEALADGFRLRFTQPADPATLVDPASYALRRFTYRWHSDYGSPEVDDWELFVQAVRVAEDGRSVELVIPGMKSGYVHELQAAGVRSHDAQPLLHDTGWYTLIETPGDEPPPHVLFLTGSDTGQVSGLGPILERDHGLTTTTLAWGEGPAEDAASAEVADLADVAELPEAEALRDADLLVLAIEGCPLSETRLDLLRRYVASGRPLVGLAGTLRDFTPRPSDAADDEATEPLETGPDIFGHSGETRPDADKQVAWVYAPDHPVLRGVTSFDSSLAPLELAVDPEDQDDPDLLLLMHGRLPSETAPSAPSPLAWTRLRGGDRTFYAHVSAHDLGEHPAARRLVLNGVLWALDREVEIPGPGCDPSWVVEPEPPPLR